MVEEEKAAAAAAVEFQLLLINCYFLLCKTSTTTLKIVASDRRTLIKQPTLAMRLPLWRPPHLDLIDQYTRQRSSMRKEQHNDG
ncbi:hypothetical protein T4B_10692 [Trichinella pseudospiralis]|uniref:Uncharacterized protein n=1 Tax=Trichinella pseudospiralis TaxID=6337 RepID=A0A0V1HUM6_TRIPS|nr:hypothetical protein T4B_10692 [Trichinella pseudospiralis]